MMGTVGRSVGSRRLREWPGVLLAGACSTMSVDDTTRIDRLTLTPGETAIAVGASLTMTAEAWNPDGAPVAFPRISWSSENPAIATVSATGVITGHAVGSVLIAASAWGRDAFSRVTVIPAPVAAIRLSMTNGALVVGESIQLAADPLDGRGAVLPDRVVTWSSSNTTVATVRDGLVTAVGAGGAIIVAASEGASAVASMTVTPVPVASVEMVSDIGDLYVGQSTQLSPLVRDAQGALLTDRIMVWTTSDPQVASVSSQGLVAAVAPGVASITVAAEGISATATVRVMARPASSVILTPDQVSLFGGQTVQLTALVTDDRGLVLAGRTVEFSSGSPAVATVSAAGLVTAVAAGTTTITARSDAITGTATVTVVPDPVATIEVTPSSGNILVGQILPLVATPRNLSGAPLSGRVVAWTSASPGVASVSSSGLVTGIAPGTAIIVASSEGKQGSATIAVRVVPVAAVLVSPAAVAATVGDQVTLTATPVDAARLPLAGRAVTWSTSDATIATVSGAGLVTAIAAGTATIGATSEGQTGVSVVTVAPTQPAGVASIVISPAASTVNVAWTTSLVATAYDAQGNAMPGVTVTWASSNAAVAAVSSTGVVTGVSPGAAGVSASWGTVSATASITVQLAPVDRVVVSPNNPMINPLESVQLTATLYDQHNNILTGRTVTWSSSDPLRVAVDGTGLATGILRGNAAITATSEGRSGAVTVRVR